MNNQKKSLLIALVAIILMVPLHAMRTRKLSSESPESSDTEVLVPATPPPSDLESEGIAETPPASDSDIEYVPDSPQEKAVTALHAERMRKRKLSLQQKKRTSELTKKKAAAHNKPKTKKPKKDD